VLLIAIAVGVSALLGYLINQLPDIKHKWSATARILLVFVVVAVSALLAAALNGNTDHSKVPSATLGPSQTSSASPSPIELTLSQYLDRWRGGPVKIFVEHYNSWVVRAAKGSDDADYTEFDMRFRIRNETTGPIDLTAAPTSLVLVMNAAIPDDVTFTVAPQSLKELPSSWNLYGMGFQKAHDNVIASGKEYDIYWTGAALGVGDEFSSSSTVHNGVTYQVPAPSSKYENEMDSIPPSVVHVLGAAWISGDGTISGFAPTSDWSGPNSIDSFVRK
jgi:hypothetical protein